MTAPSSGTATDAPDTSSATGSGPRPGTTPDASDVAGSPSGDGGTMGTPGHGLEPAGNPDDDATVVSGGGLADPGADG